MAYVILTDNGRTTKEEFNPDFVEFRQAKVLEHGGKIIGISYKGKPLRLQMPQMMLPYGVNVYQDPNNDSIQKYSVDFSFRGEEENERLAKFHSQVERFEEVLVQAACDNSMAWFKKKQDKSVIEAFFTPILKKSVDKETGEFDGKYPDTIKVKLGLKGDEFECKAFDEGNNMIDEPLDSLLVKGTRSTALIQPSFIWFAGGKFGVTVKALQMKVKVPARLDKCVIDDDEEDVEAFGGAGGDASATMSAMGNSGAAFVDDDEDDMPAEEEHEEAPAPAPAAAQPRRRRAQKA